MIVISRTSNERIATMVPYRQNSIEVVEVKPIVKSGLIRAAKPIPLHKCSPPGFWKMLWFSLIGRKIYRLSLWRCECGRIFRYSGYDWDDLSGWERENAIKAWRDKGGELSEADKKYLQACIDRRNEVV